MNLPAISSGFLNAAAAHGFTPATEKHSYIKVPDVFIGGIDGYEIGIFDGGHYQCLLIFNGVQFYRLMEAYKVRGKWEISTLDYPGYKFRSALKPPNFIGVFTAKKLADWFAYCDQYSAEIKAFKTQKAEKEAALKAEFQAAIIAAKKKGFDISLSNGGKTAYGVTEKYRLQISVSDECVTYKIEIRALSKDYFMSLPDIN